jgi:predicted small integral membrane protein
MKLQKYITRKTLIFILSIIAIVYGGILWDIQRLDKDFDQLFLLLRTARVDALYMETIVIVKFNGSKVTVINQKDSKEMTRTFSTIAKVDYDTTMGNDMIVYDRYGTGEYNKRVHGGEIMLKSLMGFRRYIHVNCTGLVTEGRYPKEES